MTTTSKQGRCYHEFYTPRGRPGRLNDGEYVERCSACDCLPVGHDEETNEPYCDCCVTQPPSIPTPGQY